MRLVQCDIIYIKWLDSGSVDGLVWQFKDDWEYKTHECETVGVFVEENEQEIIVAQSMNKDQWGRLFAIPKGSIIKTKKLT